MGIEYYLELDLHKLSEGPASLEALGTGLAEFDL